MKALLKGVDAGSMTSRSARIATALAATEAWARCDVLLTFLSMPHEVDTSPMIAAALAQGKSVAVPRIEGGDIHFLLLPGETADLPRDAWGIPVPDPAWTQLDLSRFSRPLMAAPGLAFDRRGNRLGRGKGFYDRFLAAARAAAPRLLVIGVGLDEQVVRDVPHTPADVPLDGVVTDREVVLVARS